MSYQGDYVEDFATFNLKFTTRTTAGVPSTLGGTPVISIYKANNTTQSVAGVTLTVDFDSVTGLNNVLIDFSADAFYAIANDYQGVITTGTVNGVSVVGEVAFTFSIENRFDEVDVTKLVGSAQSATDLKDFSDDGYDPGTKKVQGVVLVDTTTTNTDMVGTDNALLAADINLTAGAVDNVTLVATTTTNTDMRGTDSALLATSINLTGGTVDRVTLVDTTTANTDQLTTTAILASGDVDGFSLEETLKLLLSALSKISGAATTTNTFRAADDSKNRITATVDANGNRSAVTFDASG